MIRRIAPSLAVAALLATGCATSQPAGARLQSPVRLVAPELVAWEPDGPFDLKLAVFNGLAMQIDIVEAKVEEAQVTLFRPDGSVACKTRNPARKTYEVWAIRRLRSGTSMEIKLDLRSECRNVVPGAYRYEAMYVANNAFKASAALYQGTFTESGRVLVREGATKLAYEDLRAALDAKPDAATPAATPGDAAPAPAVAEAPAPEPAVSAAEIRACVDRELAARDLNAYGDPKGTSYRSGPPVDEFGRILYVASRNPAIRHVCGIPKF